MGGGDGCLRRRILAARSARYRTKGGGIWVDLPFLCDFRVPHETPQNALQSRFRGGGPNTRNLGPRRPWSRLSPVCRRLKPDRDWPRDSIHRAGIIAPSKPWGGADRVAVRGGASAPRGVGGRQPRRGGAGVSPAPPVPIRSRMGSIFRERGSRRAKRDRGKTARFAPLFSP